MTVSFSRHCEGRLFSRHCEERLFSRHCEERLFFRHCEERLFFRHCEERSDEAISETLRQSARPREIAGQVPTLARQAWIEINPVWVRCFDKRDFAGA